MARSSISQNLVKTALDAVEYDVNFNMGNVPDMASVASPEIFAQVDTPNSAFIEAPFGGGGYFKLSGEQSSGNYTSRKSGAEKTYTTKDYDQFELIPDNFERDSSQHFAVANILSDMRDAAVASMELYGFEPFRDGFSGATTYDGVSIFNNSHTSLAGDTIDNLATGSLSRSVLVTMITQLQQMKSQKGTLGLYRPNCLLVPPALFDEAVTITESELKSGTTDNDSNVYYSSKYRIMVKQSPFLGSAVSASQGITAGSDTAFFLISDNTPFRRVMSGGFKMDYVPSNVRDDFQALVKAKFRQLTGATNPSGIVGNAG